MCSGMVHAVRGDETRNGAVPRLVPSGELASHSLPG